MFSCSVAAALLAAFVGAASPAAAAQPSAPPPPPSPLRPASAPVPASATPAPVPTARSGTNVAYLGQPDLAAALALLIAGGGVRAFSGPKLVSSLAGDRTQAEIGSLRDRFGADQTESFLNVFTFAGEQAVRYVAAAQLSWPAAPVPDPTNGKALTLALHGLGMDPAGHFAVEYMLDHLFSHEVHVKVIDEIDAKFGQAADANFHAVLAQTLLDLNATYGS